MAFLKIVIAYIPKYNLFSLYNNICIYVSKLIIGIGKPIGMIFLEENYFSYCQQILTAVVLSFHVLAIENREITNIEK